MSAIRAVSKHARSLSRTTPARPAALRAFHSPFKVLANSPLTSPPAPGSTVSPVSPVYEKQQDHSPDPQTSHAGTKTYVVSEPDPAHTPYEVPSGAYPTSAPYQNYAAADAPALANGAQRSSTSASPAHPTLTRAVPQNESGVQESAAVRNGEAPGRMRGGSGGGLGLMDEKSTRSGEGSLPERNPAPDSPGVAERWSKLGNDNAWKDRK
ncbi:uncharacterized protein B0H18DRAFT_994889 [Fomitopsis serialis]|uniref:uncharacterized protein n=1 Tax=Fomitopsis serialis TaxID=139415 RepID=UPI002007206F|nr:uncharacterized protein B0H18DRAFT_994889 [Neoantrodia serialis]KAH9930033.1 hypothetical protein B0H18DRAFT_994889 [Neoantrodia serialis]